MTLVNRLIREAKNGATGLTIRPQDVRTIAAHCAGCSPWPVSEEEVRRVILDGGLRMLGVPVRVLGSGPITGQ